MSRHINALCWGLLFCVSLCHAQGTDDTDYFEHRFTPLSPTASALYKAVHFPISYSTGTAPVNIPIYEIVVGDLVLPISLVYRGTGNKVSENSGLIGMGWSLDAEPSVSRVVRGTSDDGGGGTTGYLANQELGKTPLEVDHGYLYKVAKRIIDEEPDDFYYKTLKRSGQFYNRRGNLSSLSTQIVSRPLAPVQITKDADGFTIIESDGIVYSFPDTNRESTMTMGGGQPGHTSGWKVSTITNPNSGEKLDFSYHSYPTYDYHFANLSHVLVENIVSGYAPLPTSEVECGRAYIDQQSPILITRDRDFDALNYIDKQVGRGGLELRAVCAESGNFNWLSQTVTGIKNLKEISFGTGKVTFEYTKRVNAPNLGTMVPVSDSYILSAVSVFQLKAGRFVLVKKVVLEQSGAWYRETLDAVKIYGADGSLGETYALTYDPTEMPRYPYLQSDHWGYHNDNEKYTYSGVAYQEITVPYNSHILLPEAKAVVGNQSPGSPLNIYIGDEIKHASLKYARAKVLTRLTYPTGGYTTFDYELNKWKSTDGTLSEGGGLRITQIKNYSANGVLSDQKTIRYGENEDGLGLGITVKESDYINEKYLYHQTPIIGGLAHSFRKTYMANSVVDYFFPSGRAVVYPYVTEYRGDESQNIGKTVYRYNYTDKYFLQNKWRVFPNLPIIQDYRTDFMFGELLEKKVYGNNPGEGYHLIEKERFEYSILGEDQPTDTYVRQVYMYSDIAFSSQYDGIYDQYYEFEVTAYNLFSVVKQRTGHYTTKYFGSDSVTVGKKTQYTSDNIFFPRTTIAYNSDGDSLVTNYRYAAQEYSTVATAMRNGNLVEYPSSVTTIKNGINELERLIIDYDFFGNKIRRSKVRKSFNGGPMEPVLEFVKYDQHGRPIYLKSKGIKSISYIWGDSFNFPLAEVENAGDNEIVFGAYDLGNGDYNLYQSAGLYTVENNGQPIGNISLQLQGTADILSLSATLTSSKVYELLFWIKGEADINLITSGTPVIHSDRILLTRGEWKLRRVKFGNVSAGYLEIVFNTPICWINGIRLSSDDARMTTYTYEPLVGMMSMTNARGITEFYEYDGLQRLKDVLDTGGNILKHYEYHYKP